MIFGGIAWFYAQVNVARLLENVTKTQAKRNVFVRFLKVKQTSQEDGWRYLPGNYLVIVL